MSYRCQKCNAVHTGAENKLTTKIRNVSYDYYLTKKDFETKKMIEVLSKSYSGTEIAEELHVCSHCYDEFNGMSPLISSQEPKHVKIVLKYRAFKPTKQSSEEPKFHHRLDFDKKRYNPENKIEE